ncbi:hypothetical protein OKA05_13020 [Luteolibacter arcticus]|uniref:PEP-CTERM protein-sorting domain-containing protein n=1 Tax=Luteolibacter arcticus TaxID=1581411 RepID=A0ABT3GIY3_9BACT|nr:hypothetical protein [Luteolibacter arcticus]MCW1923479.1 hypothetical protein [Luteolibacter arcticus]
MKAIPLLALLFASSPSVAPAAVTLFQTDNFDALGGWTSGGPNPNPPVIFADSGPLGGGDSSLRVTANGGGAGGRLVTFNRTTWTGDFTGEGVTTIMADLRNLGTSSLSVRIAFNGPGGWWITAAESVPASAPWGNFDFDIRAVSLVASDSGTNAVATLANVTEMRILHSPDPDHTGVALSSSMLIDNITAVPEPSALILLAWSPLLLKRKRRFAKNAIP